MRFSPSLVTSLATSLVSMGLCTAAFAFEPLTRGDAVSVYIYRDAKPRLSQTPPAASPMLSINGEDRGVLSWGSMSHSFQPPGEIEVVVRGENGAAWSFGRFGKRFEGEPGTVRYFKLEVVEVAPEDFGNAIRRNWQSSFREVSETEARRFLP